MDDQTKIQACWKALAPLARQATRILDGWRKYNRQADRLNELQQRALAACSRGTYPQEDGEPHWAIARRINDLRSAQTAIYERAAAVLLDLEQILPLDKMESLEQEIDRSSVRRTYQGILTAAKYLNQHCGPAPAGWPGSPGGDPDVFLDDAMIDKLEAQVKEMEVQQQKDDVEKWKRSQKEQAEAKRKAQEERQRERQRHSETQGEMGRPKRKGKNRPSENAIDALEDIWKSVKPNLKTGEPNIEEVKKQFFEYLKSKGAKLAERAARWKTAYAGFRQRRSRSKPKDDL